MIKAYKLPCSLYTHGVKLVCNIPQFPLSHSSQLAAHIYVVCYMLCYPHLILDFESEYVHVGDPSRIVRGSAIMPRGAR
jgi:hypothetical protein